MKNTHPIGVFDSGVGGLTVLRALTAHLPYEKFTYVGDTARVPYGSKSPESVKRFSLEVARFFKNKKVKLMVTACNTVSALAMGDLLKFMPVPVLGVIEPGAHAALAATKTDRVGLIGTEATVKSQAYEKVLLKGNPSLQVFSKACPLFVPLVEEGWLTHPVTRQVATIYLTSLLAKKVDTLILGCTHYPLLKPLLKKLVGPVRLIDSAEETARTVETRLKKDQLLAPPSSKGSVVCYSSDDPQKFEHVGQRLLNWNFGKVHRIVLEGLANS